MPGLFPTTGPARGAEPPSAAPRGAYNTSLEQSHAWPSPGQWTFDARNLATSPLGPRYPRSLLAAALPQRTRARGRDRRSTLPSWAASHHGTGATAAWLSPSLASGESGAQSHSPTRTVCASGLGESRGKACLRPGEKLMSYQVVGENLSGGLGSGPATTGLKTLLPPPRLLYIAVVFPLPAYMGPCNLPLFKLARSPTVRGKAIEIKPPREPCMNSHGG